MSLSRAFDAIWFFIPGLALAAAIGVTAHAQNTDEQRAWQSGLAFHGRFCGPGHPWIDPLDPASEREIIVRLQPLDLIDAACKRHDLCYIDEGMFARHCDQRIAARLRQLAQRFESQAGHDPLCGRIALIAADYFDDGPRRDGTLEQLRSWFEDASELPVSMSVVSPELVEVLVGLGPEDLRCGELRLEPQRP